MTAYDLLGPVHMKVGEGGGDPEKVRYPASVGLPISPYNLTDELEEVCIFPMILVCSGISAREARQRSTMSKEI